MAKKCNTKCLAQHKTNLVDDSFPCPDVYHSWTDGCNDLETAITSPSFASLFTIWLDPFVSSKRKKLLDLLYICPRSAEGHSHTIITIISPCSLLSLAIFPVSFIRSIFSQGSILNSITLVLLCPSIFVNVLFRKSSKRLQKPPQFDIKSLSMPDQTQINKSKFINLQNPNPQIPVKSCSLSPTCARDQMFPSSSADRSNLPRVACR